MKKTREVVGFVAGLLVLCFVGLAFSGSLFTDVTSQYGPSQNTQINAALDALEDNLDGTTPLTAPVVKGTLTLISTNSATTNVVGTVDGELDGETLEDDSVDDDAIDFSSVTGADLTLTDCTAVTASGAVYGSTVGFSAATGFFQVIGTQLVFIANSGAATNVIDADITTP
jgi:hypothetical protein